jgi:hypothetical protein
LPGRRTASTGRARITKRCMVVHAAVISRTPGVYVPSVSFLVVAPTQAGRRDVGNMRDLVRRLGVSLAITRWALRPFRPT